MEKLNVLVVDDDKNIRSTVTLGLKSLNCVVKTAESVEEALGASKSFEADLILTDYKMPGKSGIEFIKETQKQNKLPLMVLMTAFASIENAVEATKAGAFDYLPKPFSLSHLEYLLTKVRKFVELEHENQRLRREEKLRGSYFEGMTSQAMLQLEAFINKVASSDSTLLFTGESGVGKSVLARHVHSISKRATKPFIEISCTSLTETLLESELFGHVKGAFTGAHSDHMGKLECANEGTLFLDEIGDLTPSGQAKLLNFLETRTFEAVGSNQKRNINTRIIAATNRNLAEAVAARKFREDLYFRINIFEYPLTPLRFRKEDLPILILNLAKFVSKNADLEFNRKFPLEVMQALMAHHWPGNIRELRNTMERLLLLAGDSAVRYDDLPESLRKPGNPTEIQLSSYRLEDIEREHIRKVLNIENNLENAATMLGISATTLWRKRKEYGLA